VSKHVVHAACSHDCPDACGVLITVEDGRATRIQGDPAHPVTRGFLCAKVAKYLDRVYSPDRVLYPLRRVAPKGEGKGDFTDFRRVSWDEALDEIAERFHAIIRQHGAEAILPYSYGGTLAVLNGSTMDRRFFHRLGASQLARNICSEAGEAGLRSVIGAKLGTEPEQFRHSRTIIAWGANIHGNNVHLWPFIEEARRQGGRLIVIDPYRTRTAACADWYLPIHPGTDVALALGMMHVIIGEGLHDPDYVSRHTVGFEQLRERAKEYPPERVAQSTGIAAEDIVKLAREYATARPAAIRLNYGIQRSENGGMAVRAVAMLPCITGSWKEIGGGLQLSTSGAFQIQRSALQQPELMGRSTRVVNMVELGTALNELGEPPIQALFVYNSNPAAVAPDHNRVVRGLKRPNLFTVVHDQFLTDTTDYADVVLPATTFFEHKDLQTSYGHYYLQLSEQAIDPVGDCRSNVELFRALALRMGFQDACFRDSVDTMIDTALSSGHSWLEGIDRARLEREGHVRLNLPKNATSKRQEELNGFFLPFADGGFATLSGKAELYSQQLAEAGLDPVVSFVPPKESRNGLGARNDTGRTGISEQQAPGRYPLELLARKADNFLNSTFCNQPGMRKLEKAGILEITSEDAHARNIHEGDPVRVFNGRGAIRLTASVQPANGNAKIRRGVVAASLNWAKLSEDRQNVNVLTSQRLTDIGASATFYSVLVEVERDRGDRNA
jgi:anaerobic selenocysteine-containing dehydrogenase